MISAIAVVGMACVYPEARTPGELWDNVLAQRRAFRRIPARRLRSEDYVSADRSAPDCTYVAEAAVVEGYEFDRVHYRVVGSTYRSADLAHWLALDVAAQALADAGFGQGDGLPRETTGVVLGNTLTGEFSRANGLRLRWPYVRRVVDAALAAQDWSGAHRLEFLARLEESYKAPFPEVGEESLAGGLSNTIAGRICNQFDLKGGGFTVDGACASSLLAIAHACSSLMAGDTDVVLAGGVDVSLDPFELVGFAKTGALAPELMRIYDTRSAGFWPGEGCGFVVLMRLADALSQCKHVYATVRGWGISSDGTGGITRPEVEGQLQALRRAYRRAGYTPDTVGYFEGHGTGTSVGDTAELRALSQARREARPDAPAAGIGSIKANIGHTKAAAGVAGFIKASLALDAQVLPPTTGCEQPHAELTGPAPALRIVHEPELWPSSVPLRAGVSAMGFGGINAHLTLEGAAVERRSRLSVREIALGASAQDAELFLFQAATPSDLLAQIQPMLAYAGQLARSELADVAVALQRKPGDGRIRAAVVASTPNELGERLESLRLALRGGITTLLDVALGVFLSDQSAPPKIGFLFPGQGSPANLGGGMYRRRFESARQLYASAGLPESGDAVATDLAQPAIVTASLAGLRALRGLGIPGQVALGHSLGELTALHWAGVYDEAALGRIARVRGKAMGDLGDPTGTMTAIAASWQEVHALLNGDPVSVVGYNSPRQTVVAGEAEAVKVVSLRAQQRGWRTTNLRVSHAFHTPLVSAATPILAAQLAKETFHPARQPVISTITGAALDAHEDVRQLLCRQVTSPVRFLDALTQAASGVDLWIEVGPGETLTGLARESQAKPVVALDAGGPSLRGLWLAAGAAFALGAPLERAALSRGRFTRPFRLDWQPRFFANPCEQAPVTDGSAVRTNTPPVPVPDRATAAPSADATPLPSPLELVRSLVAQRAELPVTAIHDDSRLLSDLHLNSITVGQLIGDAARQLGLRPVIGLNEFANATVAQAATALAELRAAPAIESGPDRNGAPPGVDAWIRAFTVEWVERARPALSRLGAAKLPGQWTVLAAPEHPLAAPLASLLAGAGGQGVVVCMPPLPAWDRVWQGTGGVDADSGVVRALLQGAKAVLAQSDNPRFVLVQHGWNAGGFARSLHLEAPGVTTCVVEVPFDHPQAADWVRDEVQAAEGYAEARYDTAGRRWEPRLKVCPLAAAGGALPLGPADVLLVSGGGKGITAECAYALARESGASLAVLGRSRPEADAELASNLKRLANAEIRFRYCVADVSDVASVRSAVQAAEGDLGKVTAVLHGAGVNEPKAISALAASDFRRTLATKVQGLRHLLAAVDPEGLRCLITFGSIIARAGLHGEADYAVANEWLTLMTEGFQRAHPQCRCLAIEWSVWSGLGMGQRLGRVETLLQHGITPIPPDQGVAWLLELLRQPPSSTAVVVAGRYGDSPILKPDPVQLPFTRFIEQTRVFHPNVELVVDATLSAQSDPYVAEHVYQGEPLFPAVMGLEAMAQTAMALIGRSTLPSFEQVEFQRPVVVPKNGTVVIRLAALVRGPDSVEVVLRSEASNFQVDHFRAVCRFGGERLDGAQAILSSVPADRLPLEPARDLYRELMFHSGRFQRIVGYRRLRARECVAEVQVDANAHWFGRYLPPRLVLGDAGARDAAIHAIQACIPHARLLPIGVERIRVSEWPQSGPAARADQRRSGATSVKPCLFAHAVERAHQGDTFSYDVQIVGSDGRIWESWEGLRLRQMEPIELRQPWAEPLLSAYLERRIEQFMPACGLVIALNRDTHETDRSERAWELALGRSLTLHRRADGRPELPAAATTHAAACKISAAHAGQVTLVAAGPGTVGCDVEFVIPRSAQTWEDLLGRERCRLAERIAHEAAEDNECAATRVWVARECLKKAGAALDAPLALVTAHPDGWVLLHSGSLRIATFVARIAPAADRLAFGVLCDDPVARLPLAAAADAGGARATLAPR